MPGGGAFTPLSISDLVLWMHAPDESTFTFNGSRVSQWNDKGPGAHSFVQGTAAAQPLYVSDGLGGQATVRSDEDRSDSLTLDGPGPNIYGVSGYSFYAVVQGSTPAGNKKIYAERDSGSTDQFSIGSGSTVGPPKINFFLRAGGVVRINIDSSDDVLEDGTPHLISIVDTGGSWSMDIDNGTADTGTYTATALNGVGGCGLFCVYNGTAASEQLDTDIGAIVGYSKALDSSEDLQIKTYLANLFGITLS